MVVNSMASRAKLIFHSAFYFCFTDRETESEGHSVTCQGHI